MGFDLARQSPGMVCGACCTGEPVSLVARPNGSGESLAVWLRSLEALHLLMPGRRRRVTFAAMQRALAGGLHDCPLTRPAVNSRLRPAGSLLAPLWSDMAIFSVPQAAVKLSMPPTRPPTEQRQRHLLPGGRRLNCSGAAARCQRRSLMDASYDPLFCTVGSMHSQESDVTKALDKNEFPESQEACKAKTRVTATSPPS